MPKSKFRILFADDDPIVRDVLRARFSQMERSELVGEADDGETAIRLVLELQPDVLFLDLLLPQLPGIETLRELTTVTVPVKTVILCSAISKRQVVEALQLGARGVILKHSIEELEPAIDAVMRGQYWIHGKSVANIVQEVSQIAEEVHATERTRALGLTKRELEIVAHVARGSPNKEIARHLRITEDTVKRHLTHIFDKVGMSSRLELALFAVERHLVATDPDSPEN